MNKKQYIIVSVILATILVLMVAFGWGYYFIKNNKKIDNTSTQTWSVEETLSNEIKLRSFVWFVRTDCENCLEEMKTLQSFYDKYRDLANMKVVVLDGKSFSGTYSIPEDTTTPVTYKDLTGEDCEYVPSYVIYDENKKIIAQSCGNAATASVLEDKLIKENTTLKTETESKKEVSQDKNRAVANGDEIEVNYELKLEDGTKKDSSYDRGQTLPFTVWAGQMISWFDKAVVGMKIWEKKTVRLEPKDGYWEYDETRVQEVPVTELASFEQAWIKIEAWASLPTQMWVFKIKDVKDGKAYIDTNHELAWKKLIFDIEMVKFNN